MPVPVKARTPAPSAPATTWSPELDVARPRVPSGGTAMAPGTAAVVAARQQVGNAAVTSALGHLPRGAEPGPSQWAGRMLLAGQDLVGNQVIANKAATAPQTPARKPKPAKPAPPRTKAPPAPAPDPKALEGKEKAEPRDKEGKKDEAGPRSPGADPKFQALKKDVGAKKRRVGSSHPPAAAEAGAAQAASVPPADDQEARGKAAHAEDMNAAQPKEFDKAAFVTAVQDAIAKRAPKNLDEADKFGDSGKADEVKAEVRGEVDAGKDTSAQEIADTTAAAPEPAPDAKEVVPLAPDRMPGKPGAPNPAQAVPDALPPSATDMSAGPAKVSGDMAAAGVTEQQLSFDNAREPAFDKAVQDKKAMDAHSATAPGELRAGEAKEIKQVKASAAVKGAAAMNAIHARRKQTGDDLTTGKTGYKGQDQDKRTQVTALLQKVFDRTKCDVEKILSDLDKTVDEQFTTEEKRARTTFTEEHTEGMREYKSRRYSGLAGKARWVKDLFADLPEEANQIYVRAKDNYLTAMRGVINNIADTVERELRKAKDRIAAGRTELKDAVDKLPEDLRAIGREAAGDFDSQFESLKDSVNDKGTQLVDTLATKYTDAVTAVDEEIAAEKEKNKGLVSKAADAIGGVIRTIKELGRLLMGVLRKAASAIGLILKDPIGFLGNLITGVGGGLKLFMKNAGRHLQQGVLAWLLGTGVGAGLQLPTTFDVLGILVMIAGLLGLSWPNLRARLARKVDPRAMAAAETGADAIPIVVEAKKRGVAGLWSDLKTRVGDLKKDLIGKLVSYLLPTIIIAGVTWIVSLFNPASAFIRACKMIIDIIRFIVTQGRQIIEFVNTVLDAVIAIARGGTGGVPALVERALARSIPVLIGALAAILGIGGIAGKVKQIFQQLARPVNRAIDWVIDKITALLKKLWAKIKARLDKRKKKPRKPRKPLAARVRDRIRGGDDSPAGQRKRLSAALAAGVRAVNRFRGRPVAGRVLQPLLTVIRVRYGLSTLRPVVKGELWAVHGVINPEGTRDSDARTEGDQETGANPNFTEDAKAFERKLGAKAATHSASNSALAGMARKAKAYIQEKVGREWDRKAYLLREKVRAEANAERDPADESLKMILERIGSADFSKAGHIGKDVADVMAVFDRGTLTERFVHIISFVTGILARDVMDQNAAAEIDGYLRRSGLNLVFLQERRADMARRGMDPAARMGTREVTRAIAPLPPGGVVETHQDPARARRPASESRELGLTLAETGFRFSARQVRAHRELDPTWDRTKPLLWTAGAKEWMIVEHNEWVQDQMGHGLPLGAGPSGTTNTMMNAAETFGAERYATRLACIAFLVGAHHHTLVEVMVAAAPYGCDYTPGPRIYRNVKPLSEDVLRGCGKNGKFPDEAPDSGPAARR
jgi:ribosome-associated translation inhibitor RaiA